ncbi:MAG TPA: hypothetical protein VGR02_07100 [Thermoanaerobaculia bacterium]|jgi:hypothetical protein|nr:hypothetical protein [Thermoanaerobaculia bacterium]
MRRVSSAIAAAVFIVLLSAPSAFAARTVDSPRERFSPIIKIIKKLVRMLGDELVEPKP